MTVSIIPESAPFTSEQRAWLNGFLAGWTGLAEEGMELAVSTSPPAIEDASLEEEDEDFPWHDPNLDLDDRLQLAEDKPLNRRLMAAMAQLDCGACGYVCQTYSEAIAEGTESNLTLCSPGGKQTAKKLKQLVKEDGSGGSPSTNGKPTAVPAAETGYSRTNPFPATLKVSKNLNKAGSKKHTSHVEIDLSGSGLTYRVGDALGVVPTNCDQLVDAILHALELEPAVNITTPSGAAELRMALLEQYDLCSVEEELIELLASRCTDMHQANMLRSMIEQDAYDELDVLDSIQKATSAKINAQEFVDTLSPINPRLYSIASSLAAHPDEVHLTVGRVQTEVAGRIRKGVASTMFSDRLESGSKVRVFMHASQHFTVPKDPTAPMIMVGPGTGIAPFRAFLEERKATGASGRNWLFFGDQHQACDFLYDDEIAAWCEEGFLKITTAFSRDQEEKIYVQDRMIEEGAELFAWLKENGYFFVCGDARRMAVDVDRALHQVAEQFGGMSSEGAAEFVNYLKVENRYVRDVY